MNPNTRRLLAAAAAARRSKATFAWFRYHVPMAPEHMGAALDELINDGHLSKTGGSGINGPVYTITEEGREG